MDDLTVKDNSVLEITMSEINAILIGSISDLLLELVLHIDTLLSALMAIERAENDPRLWQSRYAWMV